MQVQSRTQRLQGLRWNDKGQRGNNQYPGILANYVELVYIMVELQLKRKTTNSSKQPGKSEIPTPEI